MLRKLVLITIFVVGSCLAQERFQSGEFKGFTKSPSEHIISRLDEPITIYSVRGRTIFRGKNDPLNGVVFEIRGPGDSERIRATKSNHDGSFSIARVPEGTYSFKATKDGFQSVVGTLIVSKKANRQTTIEIALPIGV
jgi:hypothetical protein